MIMLFGLFMTMIGIYCLAKLVYQGEQEASQMSKSVTLLSVFVIIIIIVVSWFMLLQIGSDLSKVFGK